MEYDHKRDEKLVEANRNAEYEKENVSIENTITFEQHMEDLKQKADAGDEKSKELYDTYMRNRKQFEHIENFHKKHNLKKIGAMETSIKYCLIMAFKSFCRVFYYLVHGSKEHSMQVV
jgi:hypothetical protein